jgi:hypothetical protein
MKHTEINSCTAAQKYSITEINAQCWCKSEELKCANSTRDTFQGIKQEQCTDLSKMEKLTNSNTDKNMFEEGSLCIQGSYKKIKN